MEIDLYQMRTMITRMVTSSLDVPIVVNFIT